MDGGRRVAFVYAVPVLLDRVWFEERDVVDVADGGSEAEAIRFLLRESVVEDWTAMFEEVVGCRMRAGPEAFAEAFSGSVWAPILTDGDAAVKDDYFARASLIARAVVTDALQRHEQHEHDGEVCLAERMNMAAFLMHSLGLTPEWSEPETVEAFKAELFRLVQDYDARHREHHIHEGEEEEGHDG